MDLVASRRARVVLAVALLQLVAIVQPLPPATAATGPSTIDPCQHGLFTTVQPTTSADCPAPTGTPGKTQGATGATGASGPAALAPSLPTGFDDTAVYTGLTNPTVVQFASDRKSVV